MKPVSRAQSTAFFAAFLLLALFAAAVGLAQQQPAKPGGAASAATVAAPAQPGLQPEAGEPQAAASEATAGEHPQEAESSQEKMERELKFSPSVRWLAKVLHVSPELGYWISLILDFCLLALLIGWALKKNLPAMFRARTQTIQRGIQEARTASEEANRRLADIEARLSRLDKEVGAMRSAAEREAAVEEQRVMATAAEDARRVVEAAESEIVAAAKHAQRELKAFAVDLAVTLAEQRIHVDAATDQALVRGFTGQLGAADDGGGPGKDGQ
jgi:F-type H+-transporting ATPase subunit b